MHWHLSCNPFVHKGVAFSGDTRSTKETTPMFTLPDLPFPRDALEPWVSRETLDYHHGKHHAAYVHKLNTLVENTELESLSLESLVRASAESSAPTNPVFDNAAQAWNHAFYWQCLTPQKSVPDGVLSDLLNAQFGSVAGFQQRFSQAAMDNFGSGWTWLVSGRDGKLEIVNTRNAGTPLTTDKTPLLTCDVWEHAYYIDYRNARADYLQGFWKVVNWDFAGLGLRRLVKPQNAA